MKKILCLAFVLVSIFKSQAQTLFNTNWEFVKDIDTTTSKELLGSKGDKTIKWEKVTLPHTPQIEPVIKEKEQWQGTCYYRKFFAVPERDAGKYVAIQFDGAMNDADVYLNGKQVGKHIGGYLPFTIEVSGRVKLDAENCILVKLKNVDNPHIPPGKPIKDLDFNFYGGIYRNAWLIEKQVPFVNDAVAANHEAGGGIVIHYEDVTQTTAKMIISAEVQSKQAWFTVVHFTLFDADGKELLHKGKPTRLSNTNYTTVSDTLIVKNPKLWSPTHPYLYNLQVVVKDDDMPGQITTIKTGIKTFRFAVDGFYLNGEKLNIMGTNRHQEYPYIGYALSDNAQYRDAYKIKDAGFNFVRCSHYPPSPAFLDACDELGILVMDAIPGWQFFGDEVFQQNSYQNIRDMIHRDRNHASIVLWEASLNESGMSKAYMTEANRIVHAELPFKDVYSTGWIDYAYDVFNPARQHAQAPDYWKKYSKGKPLLLAEYGDWEYYAQNAGFNQKAYEGLKKEERNSRQLRTDGETRMLQQAYNFQEAHNDDLNGPNFGDANWLMFDYKRGYASDIESSGIMDIYRLPKFAFYFYQSQYGPKPDDQGFGKPMAFIANYWNDPKTQSVRVYSNCDEVELFLNGRSIGIQHPDKDANSNNLPHPPFTFAISKFEPGKLEAVGYVKGVKVADAVRQTPGKAYAIKLRVDESGKKVEGGIDDVVFVYASVVDANGTVVPDAANSIDIGDYEKGNVVGMIIMGIGNAEAGVRTHLLEISSRKNYSGKWSDIVVVASSDGLKGDSITIPARK